MAKRFGARDVVRDLDLRIMRGDRLALLGPQRRGQVDAAQAHPRPARARQRHRRLGTKLDVAYFDQLREALDAERRWPRRSARAPTGSRRRTAASTCCRYLGDFLFPPHRANAPVKTLSGGERNRLLLARLFAQPANLLVLDEPTNDLDIESLELLEATLQAYAGTLLLVSHDRAFLDNVVTQTLAAEGDGAWQEYVGGYSDWLAQRSAPVACRTRPQRRRAEPRRARGARRRACG